MGVVLVVEDEPINAALAEAVLVRDGHLVVLTGHGATALELARERQPDLVVLDVCAKGSASRCRAHKSRTKSSTRRRACR